MLSQLNKPKLRQPSKKFAVINVCDLVKPEKKIHSGKPDLLQLFLNLEADRNLTKEIKYLGYWFIVYWIFV